MLNEIILKFLAKKSKIMIVSRLILQWCIGFIETKVRNRLFWYLFCIFSPQFVVMSCEICSVVFLLHCHILLQIRFPTEQRFFTIIFFNLYIILIFVLCSFPFTVGTVILLHSNHSNHFPLLFYLNKVPQSIQR